MSALPVCLLAFGLPEEFAPLEEKGKGGRRRTLLPPPPAGVFPSLCLSVFLPSFLPSFYFYSFLLSAAVFVFSAPRGRREEAALGRVMSWPADRHRQGYYIPRLQEHHGLFLHQFKWHWCRVCRMIALVNSKRMCEHDLYSRYQILWLSPCAGGIGYCDYYLANPSLCENCHFITDKVSPCDYFLSSSRGSHTIRYLLY